MFPRRPQTRPRSALALTLGCLTLLLPLTSITGLAAGAIEGKTVPALLGKTSKEVRELFGAPRYIKVTPHDNSRQFAYFTPEEWARLGELAPASQGEDVYLMRQLGLQLHLAYQPTFTPETRFSPVYRVSQVTYVFDEPVPLKKLADLLPLPQGGGFDLAQAEWYRRVEDGRSRTLLVHWARADHPQAASLTPFRADPKLTLVWEIGLGTETGKVDSNSPVSWIVERLEQFLYTGQTVQAIPSPLGQ